MKKPRLLDSHAALVYLKREKGYEKVKGALSAAEKSNVPLLMSEMNIGEVCYIVLRSRLATDVEDFLSLFLSLPIERVQVDFDLIIQASKIKSKYPVSYADAFAAATAIRKDAAIITGDPEFKALTNLVQIDWL